MVFFIVFCFWGFSCGLSRLCWGGRILWLCGVFRYFGFMVVVEYLQGVVLFDQYFGDVVCDFGIVLLVVGVQLVFDVGLCVFMQVFVCYFCEFVEYDNMVLFGVFVYFFCLFVMLCFRCGQCQIGYCVFVGYVMYFWVLFQMFNQNDFVNVMCCYDEFF